jgi:hypothetical protein
MCPSVDLLCSVRIQKIILCVRWCRCGMIAVYRENTRSYLHMGEYYLVPVVWWYPQRCMCGGRFFCAVVICFGLRASCRSILSV